jgi:hypothetical protein
MNVTANRNTGTIHQDPECKFLGERGELITRETADNDDRSWDECKICFQVGGSKAPHCPECRKANITARHGDFVRDMSDEPKWACYGCDHRFDEPVMILTHARINTDTLAGKLQDMDPDDVVPPEELDQ